MSKKVTDQKIQDAIDKEVANSWTHGLGMLASVIGSAILLRLALARGMSGGSLAVLILFCFGLISTYASSTFYHAWKRPRVKYYLRVLDHICIYLLIGASYTPFVYLFLRGVVGPWFLIVLWLLIVMGVFYKIFYFDGGRFFSTLYYLTLGWMAIIIIKPLIENLPPGVLETILWGGFFYTTGVIFYSWKYFKYHHAIWHLFVMAGSFCHYLALYNSVLAYP
jgi:hemolysin III